MSPCPNHVFSARLTASRLSMQSLKSSCRASRSVLAEFRFDRCSAAQKRLVLSSRSFQFAVNRINHLVGVRRQGFWAKRNGSKSGLPNAPLKQQLFSPLPKVMSKHYATAQDLFSKTAFWWSGGASLRTETPPRSRSSYFKVMSRVRILVINRPFCARLSITCCSLLLSPYCFIRISRTFCARPSRAAKFL